MVTVYPRWKGAGDYRRPRVYDTTPTLSRAHARLAFNASARTINWTDFGTVIRTVDSEEYGGGIFSWTVNMKSSTASIPARARIYNITDSEEVVGSQLSTISLSAVEVTSEAFTLSGEKAYKAQVGNATLIPEAPITPSADATLLLRWIQATT